MTHATHSEPHYVIAVYKPRPGCEAALDELTRQHLPLLQREGLVADEPVTRLRAADGSILEIFAWRSTAAVDKAHENSAVMGVWERFGELCEYVPLATLAECQSPFAGFRKFE